MRGDDDQPTVGVIGDLEDLLGHVPRPDDEFHLNHRVVLVESSEPVLDGPQLIFGQRVVPLEHMDDDQARARGLTSRRWSSPR